MNSLVQFFQYMHDIDFPYVVLRNWDHLPHSVEVGDHSDLDILVYDLDHWKEVFAEAKAEFPFPRVRYRLPVGDEYIFMDVRYVGDGYYPADLEQTILDTREWNPSGFYTPDPIRHRVSLAYHVVHHKNANTYQRWLGNASVKELFEALKESDVGWVPPVDQSVGRFNPYWKSGTSIVNSEGDHVVKRQDMFKNYDLINNEHRILSKISSIHFPKVINVGEDTIQIEHCGVPLNINNLPKDWKTQLIRILLELKSFNVMHRDIKPDNLLVKDGVIKLIDFGWARFEYDPPDSPPECLGYPYKPSYGFDDKFSMRKIIKEIDYKLEQKLEEAIA